MPIEPPPSRWAMGDRAPTDDDDLVALGADLEPGTLLGAYRAGLFPMPVSLADEDGGTHRVMGWWSPDPRGVVPLHLVRVSRSLRRSLPRFDVTVDEAFDEVVTACADPSRPGGWITDEIRHAYGRLHALGWAHSVEVRSPDDGSLVGGLYGVRVGSLFAGESMFHRATDASKVALVVLVAMLVLDGAWLLDVQWRTEHLASLGAIDVPRLQYLNLCADAVAGRAAPEQWPDETGSDTRR